MGERAVVTTEASEAKQKCLNSCKQNSGFNSSGSTANGILQLQRTAGNQAVQRLIKSGVLQAKLRIGQPNDIYEQEAERVANQIMRTPNTVSQRKKCTKCDEDEKKVLLAKESPKSMQLNQGQDVPPIVHEVLNSPGRPIDPTTRAYMESRFGYDFSFVRVHTDARAGEAAQAINALAYTVGKDVVFGSQQYLQDTVQGQRLLAHELAHVIQQGGAAPQIHYIRLKANDNMTQKQLPVPTWNQLPAYAQGELGSRGYNENWFIANNDTLRLTVLNLYVKLNGLGLWRYVGSETGTTGTGTLEFNATDVNALKETLTLRDDFTSPEKSKDEWSSREMRASGQLHFKHFNKWPDDKVQAHIDQHGLLLKSKWWWLTLVVPLAQMSIHGMTYKSYKEVIDIRNLLLEQGWDPLPLKGVARSRSP